MHHYYGIIICAGCVFSLKYQVDNLGALSFSCRMVSCFLPKFLRQKMYQLKYYIRNIALVCDRTGLEGGEAEYP